MINEKLPVLLLLHTLNSKLTSPVAFMGLTRGSQTLPSMRFPWTCLLGGLITTQTAGPPLRISWFSSSGEFASWPAAREWWCCRSEDHTLRTSGLHTSEYARQRLAGFCPFQNYRGAQTCAQAVFLMALWKMIQRHGFKQRSNFLPHCLCSESNLV